MSEITSFTLTDEATFKLKALAWADQFSVVCLLDSNSYIHDKYTSIEWLLAIDALDSVSGGDDSFGKLKAFTDHHDRRIFGFLSYDLKNELEVLTSDNTDHIGFPLLYFFKPRYTIEVKGGKVIFNRNYPEAFDLYERIMQSRGGEKPEEEITTPDKRISLTSRTEKGKYLTNVNRIKDQIKAGDFYELNYCCEFYAEHTEIQPLEIFNKVNVGGKAPFSTYFKLHDKYLLCASPERFLKKAGTDIISQPIKGTIKKGATQEENEMLRSELYHSIKERAENVMIVDLVRNDLAKSAVPGTVKVEELFGIYDFATVHQMISTVTATVQSDMHPVDIIKNAFPMGSMTGAPKVEVMKNIEQYEDQKRGLYSGAVGYLTPEGDLDLNVVIRSIFYNARDKYLSIQVGGAITYDADAQSEYDEMLLKARGMLDALGATIRA